MREDYGATHYLIRGSRGDLAGHLLFASGRYSVYELTSL